MILGDIPRRNSVRFPNKVAMIFHGRSWTWQEINYRVNSLAGALRSRGLEPGDRVGIMMQNGPQYWEIYWACAKTGLICVPLNYKLRAGELRSLLENAEPKLILVSTEYMPLIIEVKAESGWPKELVEIEDQESQGVFRFPKYEDLIKCFPPVEPQAVVGENDPFAIFYTSGTTGLPKAAIVSHRNLIANSFNQMLADRSTHEDVNYIVTPIYHMGAVFMGVTYTLLGCTQVIQKHFDVEEWLTSISEQRITVCLLIPTMLNLILNHPEFSGYDLSALRLIFYGGGPMPSATLEKAIRKIGCGFTQGYGLTETLEATFLVSADHVLEGNAKQKKRLLSTGRETVGAEVRVVDEVGQDMPTGAVGEILIKSASVISGYWHMPKITETVIRDGWFYTGDIGYLDEDRYLFVVDRKKDMIISGGVNIYPKEIENILYAHPAVLEAAVVGVPDDIWVEAVKAYVVLRDGYQPDQEDIISFCKEHLASYKKPRYVEFVHELPKNPSGKILKRLLREQV